MDGGNLSARLSGDEIIARLETLIPRLRARAAAAEEAGRISQETIQDLIDTGVFRAVVPVRFGGFELDYRYVPLIFRTLGRGCVSTAWTMGFLIYHNFQFAHFPEEAQQEVWGHKQGAGRGFTMAPGQVMPAGKAIAVDGGFRLSGRWGYATGINHGDWMLFSAPVVNSGQPNDVRRFYAPVSDFRVLDTWKVSAMRATGSHDVELDDVFVPEYRSVKVSDLRNVRAAGLQNNSGYLWRIPLLSYMVPGGAGPLVGAAEAMFEIVTDTLRNKVRAYSLNQAKQQMSTRVRLSQIDMRLRAMLALYENTILEIENTVRATGTLDLPARARNRAVMSHTVAEA
ncbi:MAG: hypothetical protein FJX29_00085, partial [Alphaproteobacteria bacterium]|nr:hypothetical protein [Alphaproteobacteria bacterium]